MYMRWLYFTNDMEENMNTKEVALVWRGLICQKQNQGYAVRSNKKLDYHNLIIHELTRLEEMYDDYSAEFMCISKFVRRYLWTESNEKTLYELLNELNEVHEILANVVTPEVFWELDVILYYAIHLKNYAKRWRLCEDSLFDKLCDDIQIAGAQKIISKQWENILQSVDGMGAFIAVFDDLYKNAIEKYEKDFIYSLEEKDVLCRMVKETECDENRFIPWPNKVQNRWNPPGKTYLYLSYGKDDIDYNNELKLGEYICLLECKMEEETDTCFCRFKPTKKGRILDLSYNDLLLSELRENINMQSDEHAKSLVEKMLKDPNVLEHKNDSQYIEKYVRDYTNRNPFDKELIERNAARQILKLVCSCIYKKVNEKNEADLEKAYKSFHILAEYLENKGITGIIYPCTRTTKVVGKNVVLFDIKDAEPIEGTIKKYHFCGDYGAV